VDIGRDAVLIEELRRDFGCTGDCGGGVAVVGTSPTSFELVRPITAMSGRW
jgi:hypothetical protein